METIRLCYLAPEFLPTWGGVGIYSVNLIKELSKRKDMEIHVITPERGKDYDKQKVLDYVRNANISDHPKNPHKDFYDFGNKIQIHNISKANDTFFYNFTFQNAVAREFPKLHAKYKFDLVHSANLVHMPDIWLKFRKEKVPSVVTVHTTISGQVSGFLESNKNFFKMAPSEKMSLLAYPYIKTLESIYLAKTKNLLTVSKKTKGMLFEKYKDKKIEVTYNGIDKEVFNFNKVKGYGKFSKLKDKKDIVLYSGRLITQKGIEIFVRLMGDVDAHFVVAGRGDEKLFFNLVKKYDIPKEKFTFLGFVDNSNLPWLYRLSKVFVLPSYYENFSIALLEAMAMKTACVASDAGATDEIIENGKNGMMFKVGDYGGMKEQVLMILGNEKLREKIAEEGRKKVLDNFTSERMAEKTWNFYKGVLK